MIGRRQLLSLAALAAPAMAFPGLARAALPDLSRIPTRKIDKVDVVYKTPHGKPNGMDVTKDGFWVIDQGNENYVSLINPETGALIREFKAEGVRSASGVGIDDQGVAWIGSTYNRLIVACDSTTGKSLGRYSTPGAGQIYRTRVDQPGHRTPLQPAYPPEPPAPPVPGAPPRPTGRRGWGPQEPDAMEGPTGTGAHCVLPKGDLLYVDVPPARMIFVIDKKTWIVQDMFPTAGDRPHDMAWADAGKTKLWCSDSNLGAFFLHDAATGAISQRIQLPDDAPVIHGAKVHNGYMYYCDDVGWMCRFKL
jgi:streptogramin lyase